MSHNVFEHIAVPGVRVLQPYQPGKPVSELERELGIENIIKLASNENPIGPSPRVLEAIQSELSEITRYPDGNGFKLKRALSEKLRVEPEQITLGNGSNDVLELIARTFLSPSNRAVYSQHAFAVYPLVVQAVGAGGEAVPAADRTRYGHDLSAMAKTASRDCAVVFIANPNNPTGSYCSSDEFEKFMDSVPNHTIVVMDEAYFEYVEIDDYPNALESLGRYQNLIVTRTFSKAYGLAGLRSGYAISNPEIADLLNRVRQPFNVNSLALAAAEIALSDQDYIDRSRAANRQGLKQLCTGLKQLGFSYIPSVANFVCFECQTNAMLVYANLLKQGVIVRPVANYDLPQHLRVSVGTERENIRFLEALSGVSAND